MWDPIVGPLIFARSADLHTSRTSFRVSGGPLSRRRCPDSAERKADSENEDPQRTQTGPRPVLCRPRSNRVPKGEPVKKSKFLPPRRGYQRAEHRALWVNEPLQLAIRDELDRREWSISDLGRAIDSQPSLISRWMQGQR